MNTRIQTTEKLDIQELMICRVHPVHKRLNLGGWDIQVIAEWKKIRYSQLQDNLKLESFCEVCITRQCNIGHRDGIHRDTAIIT